MLDKEEFEIASSLYSKAFKTANSDRQDRYKELLEYYNNLTGFRETEPNAILHHSLEQIGSDCEKCGKPYRTPKAEICMVCGNRRELKQ